MVQLNITLNQEVDDERMPAFLKILGELIINRVKVKIRQFDLISEDHGGDYLQGWFATVNGNTLTIENRMAYAVYLEYGTYDYFNQFGESSFPPEPVPKKKDLPLRIRKQLPKGMAPFAPVRRIIYNPQELTPLLQVAASQFVQ